MKIRLKELRQANRLFQSDMASIMRANQSTISRMELRDEADISFAQYGLLKERFGEEELSKYMGGGGATISGNTNVSGTQNNSVNSNDAALEIIRGQAETMAAMMRKQAEQSDKLLALLEADRRSAMRNKRKRKSDCLARR